MSNTAYSVVKCDNCGKCFMVMEDQVKCPFCKQPWRDTKKYDLPEGFAGIFGFNK